MIDAVVKELLNLKGAYKAVTGVDWSPNATVSSENKPATAGAKPDSSKKSEKVCSK